MIRTRVTLYSHVQCCPHSRFGCLPSEETPEVGATVLELLALPLPPTPT